MQGLVFLYLLFEFICFLFSLLGDALAYDFNSLIFKILYLLQLFVLSGFAMFFGILADELTTIDACLVFLGDLFSLMYASHKMEKVCTITINKRLSIILE